MISLVAVTPFLSKKLMQKSLHDEHLIYREQYVQVVISFKDKIKTYTRNELLELRAMMKIYFQIEPISLGKDYLYQINKQLKRKIL